MSKEAVTVTYINKCVKSLINKSSLKSALNETNHLVVSEVIGLSKYFHLESLQQLLLTVLNDKWWLANQSFGCFNINSQLLQLFHCNVTRMLNMKH